MGTGTSQRSTSQTKKNFDKHGDLSPYALKKMGNFFVNIDKQINPRDVYALAGGSVQNLAGHASILGNDSDPSVNVASSGADYSLAITWDAGTAETGISQILFQIDVDGIDEDEDAQLVFNAEMASSNDTPTLAIKTFWGEGDTAVSDTTGALAETRADVTATIASGDIPANARKLTVLLTPGGHETDTLSIYEIRFKASRKFPVKNSD